MTLKRGQQVFKENDAPRAAYLVKEGECEVTKIVYDNKYQQNKDEKQLKGGTQSTAQTKKFN